jgi:Ca-activated chloride channel family protein
MRNTCPIYGALALICVCAGASLSGCALSGLHSLRSSAQQTLQVDVNLVNVFATVQDEQGQFVNSLSPDDFRIYEDDVLQDIDVFEHEDHVPSSVGMLVDTSGSMIDVLPFMTKGIRDFTASLPREDEFSVVAFGAVPRTIHQSHQGQRRLEDSLTRLRAYGTSLLFDALLYSSDEIARSERTRKALVVFTDGIFTDDKKTDSPYSRVVEEVQRSSLLLYFIVTGPRIIVDSNTVESLSNLSGGRTFYATRNDSISDALNQIRLELSEQYHIGYYSPRKSGFHHIRVEVLGRGVRIRAKTGYFGG